MALKATIFKLSLDISDLSRHYYQNHTVTLARHPSENDERMMMRVLAFALNADEHLEFTRGLSTDDEPDLWQKSLSGELLHWIEVGRPSEERIRKACGKAKRVSVYAFGGHTADVWRDDILDKLQRYTNLRVYNVGSEASSCLAAEATRSMTLQCTIDEDTLWFSSASTTIEVTPELVFPIETL